MGVEDGVMVAVFCFVFALVIASAFLYENIELINHIHVLHAISKPFHYFLFSYNTF